MPWVDYVGSSAHPQGLRQTDWWLAKCDKEGCPRSMNYFFSDYETCKYLTGVDQNKGKPRKIYCYVCAREVLPSTASTPKNDLLYQEFWSIAVTPPSPPSVTTIPHFAAPSAP